MSWTTVTGVDEALPRRTQVTTAELSPPTPLVDLWPDVSPESVRRLLLAALEAFAELGYHGTTTRDIAKRANMSPAAIYTHYKSKSELLYQISWTTHLAMLREMQAVFARPANAIQRLRNLVASHVCFHARMRMAARVANYELSALEPEQRAKVMELREGMEDVVREAIRLGIDSGHFEADDLEAATILIVSLGIDVSRWFVAGKRLSPEQLGETYADMVLRMLIGNPALKAL